MSHGVFIPSFLSVFFFCSSFFDILEGQCVAHESVAKIGQANEGVAKVGRGQSWPWPK